MSVLVRNKGAEELSADGVAVAPGEQHQVDAAEFYIEGEVKSCEIENQSAVAVHMTLGDLDDGGSEMEIPAGATITVSGPHLVHIKEVSHA